MMDFETFVSKGDVKKQVIDKNLAKSLKEQAEKKKNVIEKLEITQENKEVILEEYYEAMQMLANSLLALNGYKSYSHEATIAFLAKDKSFSTGFIENFDRLRRLRHGIRYYGKGIEFSDAMEAKELSKILFEKLK